MYQTYDPCGAYVSQLFVRRVRAGKDCIGLCQYLQLVALHLHSLEYCVDVVDHLVMLFWRGRRYIVYFCAIAVYSPFPAVVTALL